MVTAGSEDGTVVLLDGSVGGSRMALRRGSCSLFERRSQKKSSYINIQSTRVDVGLCRAPLSSRLHLRQIPKQVAGELGARSISSCLLSCLWGLVATSGDLTERLMTLSHVSPLQFKFPDPESPDQTQHP